MYQASLLSYQSRLIIRVDARPRSSPCNAGIAFNLLQARNIHSKPIYDASYAARVIPTVCADATVNVVGHNSNHADSKK